MESILKTTIVHEDGRSVTAQLDGDLNESSEESLRQFCRHYQLEKGKWIILDLTGLRFIDKFGLKALAEIKTQGMETIHGSLFIQLMIETLGTNANSNQKNHG